MAQGRGSLATVLLAVAAVLAILVAAASARLRDNECQVCLGVLEKAVAAIPDGKAGDAVAVEKALKGYCKTALGRENRFCYYVGATEDAASSILKDVVGPIAGGLPRELICERLKKRDPVICELQYEAAEAALDWKTADLNKLRVRDLRKLVTDIGAECNRCTEKSEYIRVLEQARVAAPAGKSSL